VEKCILDAPLLLNYTASRSDDTSGRYQLQAKIESEVILLPSPPIPPIVQERYQQIIKHSFFSLLSNKSHFLLALDSQIEYFDADSTIFQMGDPSDSIFILLEGVVAVQTTERNIPLSTGAIFGEMGFLSGSPRNAAIKAETKISLLRIPSHSLHLCIQLDNSLNESLEQLASSREQA
jgi:CRP-like cAMP-binding protein